MKENNGSSGRANVPSTCSRRGTRTGRGQRRIRQCWTHHTLPSRSATGCRLLCWGFLWLSFWKAMQKQVYYAVRSQGDSFDHYTFTLPSNTNWKTPAIYVPWQQMREFNMKTDGNVEISRRAIITTRYQSSGHQRCQHRCPMSPHLAWASTTAPGNSTAAAKSPQSCPTLCDPTDGSPPGCPVPGILQARTLAWAATSFSRRQH